MSTLRSPLLRRMSARSTREQHRAASPLELFFDLCIVATAATLATTSQRRGEPASEGQGRTDITGCCRGGSVEG
ncbi:hypothetical protein ACGFWI_38180 [Streptomyces sp. NPDC048434]|uniref:hypothetical protein n=1 Tax=Streptomyces sp. NPDC048434 TaxID=3365549 RepID=UPI0037189EC7